MLSNDCTVQRDPEVISAEADKDIVMVGVASGCYYGVSDVGREIWSVLEEPKKVSDLVDYLLATFEVDRATCEEQTLTFLEELLADGLIQVRDDAPE